LILSLKIEVTELRRFAVNTVNIFHLLHSNSFYRREVGV
jgi:hypothetical protein